MNREERRKQKKLSKKTATLKTKEPADHKSSQIYLQQGLEHHQNGQFAKALTCYYKTLELQPDNQLALVNLSIILKRDGKIDEAITNCEKAISINPNNADAHSSLASALKAQGKYELAIKSYKNALAIDPNFAEANFNLAIALNECGQTKDATTYYKAAVALDPSFIDAYNNLAIILREDGKLDEVINIYKTIIAIQPDFPHVQNNLGNALKKQGRFTEAIECYNKVIATDPNDAGPHNNKGLVYHQQDKLEDAYRCFNKAIEINPGFAEIYNNLGNLLADQGKFIEAITNYKKAIAIRPDYAEVHYNLGLSLYLQGDMKNGWEELEWRLLRQETKKITMAPNIPLWHGEPLNNKNILLYMEQGIGDEVMFAMFLFHIETVAANVLVAECTDRLLNLFKRTFPKTVFIKKTASISPYLAALKFDYQTMAGSVARFYENSFENYSKTIGKLQPEKSILSSFINKYKKLAYEKLIVGISWKTNNKISGKNRSTTLENMFGNLIKKHSKSLFLLNLQYGDVDKELANFSQETGYDIYNDKEVNSLDSLEEFAAQVAACDLIISIDNSTVHFAGAMGVPVWVLLPLTPDWRWSLASSDCRWYPSCTLFRQKQYAQWSHVTNEVEKTLLELIKNRF
ncbi:MAG: tetratricopeptide repeat protein [Magnetococcales bacterium]|nr:tetratricopeptide repeat protein [Magnetococcales bacterium]